MQFAGGRQLFAVARIGEVLIADRHVGEDDEDLHFLLVGPAWPRGGVDVSELDGLPVDDHVAGYRSLLCRRDDRRRKTEGQQQDAADLHKVAFRGEVRAYRSRNCLRELLRYDLTRSG